MGLLSVIGCRGVEKTARSSERKSRGSRAQFRTQCRETARSSERDFTVFKKDEKVLEQLFSIEEMSKARVFTEFENASTARVAITKCIDLCKQRTLPADCLQFI